MDINFQRKQAKNRNNLINSKYEQPFELDCTLPDYCRDVEKLLNTTVNPVVCSVSMNDNKVTIDGNNLITVFYTDSENNISKYESKMPFSKSVELKSPPQNPNIEAEACEGYINCRAVSPRRLDIRGTTQIDLDIISNEENSIIDKIDCDDMEILKKTCEGAEAIGQYTKQFTIKDSISLNDKKAAYIIRYNMCPTVTEYKLLPDKAILKGDLCVIICYCGENENKISTEEIKIPYSQIIDCPNIDENCLCDYNLKIINSEIMYSTENECKFNISATIYANIIGYKKVDVTGIKDCFCHTCDCTFKTKNINVIKIVDTVNKQFSHTENISVDDCTEIVDVWCKPVSSEYEYSNSTVKVKLRTIICLLGIREKQYCCLEKPVIITLDILNNVTIDNLCFNPHINIVGCKFSDINNGKIDVTCNIKINGIIFDKLALTVIDDVKLDKTTKKKPNTDSVIIYYAHSRESLWDIAKKYNTSADYIKKQNNITGDYMEKGQTLLITPFRFDFQLMEE